MSDLLNILIIDSSCRIEGSYSRTLTRMVSEHYKKLSPSVNIVKRDVGRLPVNQPNEEWITANLTSPSDRTDDNRNALKLSDELIAELKMADIVVFGCPMYNFNISASMKAYLDLVCRSGHTFDYGPSGPVGRLVDKKAIICTTSAGVASNSDGDFVSSYMKYVCGFIGITDTVTVSANCLMTDPDAVMRDANASINDISLGKNE